MSISPLTLEIDKCSVSHSISHDVVHKTGFYIGSSSNSAEDIVPFAKKYFSVSTIYLLSFVFISIFNRH
jgi:hypothetical protein